MYAHSCGETATMYVHSCHGWVLAWMRPREIQMIQRTHLSPLKVLPESASGSDLEHREPQSQCGQKQLIAKFQKNFGWSGNPGHQQRRRKRQLTH